MAERPPRHCPPPPHPPGQSIELAALDVPDDVAVVENTWACLVCFNARWDGREWRQRRPWHSGPSPDQSKGARMLSEEDKKTIIESAAQAAHFCAAEAPKLLDVVSESNKQTTLSPPECVGTAIQLLQRAAMFGPLPEASRADIDAARLQLAVAVALMDGSGAADATPADDADPRTDPRVIAYVHRRYKEARAGQLRAEWELRGVKELRAILARHCEDAHRFADLAYNAMMADAARPDEDQSSEFFEVNKRTGE